MLLPWALRALRRLLGNATNASLDRPVPTWRQVVVSVLLLLVLLAVTIAVTVWAVSNKSEHL
jgi:hypothetical protein